MTKTIQTLIFTIALILTLSITVKGKPIFNHMYSVLSHLTIPTQKLTEDLFADAKVAVEDYSRKLFDNSVPKVGDSVKSKFAAPARKLGQFKDGVKEPQESILREEKEELDDLIKKH